MGLPIPIIDGVIDVGKTIINKIWMDKADKEQLTLTKDQLRKEFTVTLKQLAMQDKLQDFERVFKEHQAQRDFANDQFGTAQAMAQFGWVGKLIMLGRASIRWVITGGSMFFTWKILNSILTDSVVNSLAVGTLAGSASYIVGLLIVLVIGIPLFYVSGISVEKIMGKRNKL
jgi:hypothetical protein